jgi:hypothetical protein
MRIFSTASVLALLLLIGASAQQPPAAPPAASIQAYGDTDKTCKVWTDSCRTCQRSDAGEPACSNIGPACQPAAITCARRSEAK